MNWIRAQTVASAAGLLAYLLVGRKPYTLRSHRSECVVGQINSKLFSSIYQISQCAFKCGPQKSRLLKYKYESIYIHVVLYIL